MNEPKFNTLTDNDWCDMFAVKDPSSNSMKQILALLLIGTAKLNAGDDLRFLDAIAQVETGRNDQAVGACGARGRYQISRVTWEQHAPKMNHKEAQFYTKSTVVALKHLAWLRKVAMQRNGEEPTYYKLAWWWKCGVNHSLDTESNEQLIARVDYANRVIAIMEDKK